MSRLLPFGDRIGRRTKKAIGREKAQGQEELGNRRVREIDGGHWAKERIQKFTSAVEWSAKAKEYRTHKHVTQGEVGMEFGGYTGSRVGQWESGHYFSWDEESYQEYCDMVDRAAGRVALVTKRRAGAGR